MRAWVAEGGAVHEFANTAQGPLAVKGHISASDKEDWPPFLGDEKVVRLVALR